MPLLRSTNPKDTGRDLSVTVLLILKSPLVLPSSFRLYYTVCAPFKHSSVSPRDASTILSISLRHPNTTSPAPAIAAPIYSSSPSTTPYISYPIHSRPDSHDGPITFQDGEANKIQGVILLGSRRQSRINHNLLSIKPLFPLASRRSILPCRLTRCFTISQRW